ncbi:hypothetical protein HDV05_004316 [Chytridiales sp. JEL 0842]|nr:hypothetical protein HDV05_004316 [Chytridiales sp. JEL 0842]
MGKTGKERKKRKLMNEIAAASGGGITIPALPSTHNHPSKKPKVAPSSDSPDHKDTNPGRKQHAPVHNPIEPEDLQTTIKVLHVLSASPELLRQPAFKVLRTVLYNVQKTSVGAGINAGSTLIGKISDSLHDQRWDEALEYLQQLRQSPQTKLKLGTLQRWVRDCDAAASKVQKSIQVDGDGSGDKTLLMRDKKIMTVLDSILRVADPSMTGSADSDYEEDDEDAKGDHGMLKIRFSDVNSNDDDGVVRFLDAWDPYPERKDKDGKAIKLENEIEGLGCTIEPSEETKAKFIPTFKMILQELGPNRRPPNHHPMIMYTSLQPPTTLADPSPNPLTTTCHKVPHIRGAYLIRDLLSLQECRAIINASESLGFTPDEPVWSTNNGVVNGSVLAHNVFWHADPEFMKVLEERVLDLLPPTMIEEHDDEELREANQNSASKPASSPNAPPTAATNTPASKLRYLAGINPRFRVYRYTSQSIYRPHIDGAWPPSTYVQPKDTNGNPIESKSYYIHDASNGTTWSKLTFLIYLNEGFQGGHTTYFIPSKTPSVLDARSIKPRAGCAMVFPHGCVKGCLLHEGSAVLGDREGREGMGAKYVIRTEVLYKKKD